MNLKNFKRDPVYFQKWSVIYRIHIPVLFLLLFYYMVHLGSTETPELSEADLCLLHQLIRDLILRKGSNFYLSHTWEHIYSGEWSAAWLGRGYSTVLQAGRSGDNFSRAQQPSCPKRNVFSNIKHS